jgi:hypothetical protein
MISEMAKVAAECAKDPTKPSVFGAVVGLLSGKALRE